MSRTFRNRPEHSFDIEHLDDWLKHSDNISCPYECCSQKARRKTLGNSIQALKKQYAARSEWRSECILPELE